MQLVENAIRVEKKRPLHKCMQFRESTKIKHRAQILHPCVEVRNLFMRWSRAVWLAAWFTLCNKIHLVLSFTSIWPLKNAFIHFCLRFACESIEQIDGNREKKRKRKEKHIVSHYIIFSCSLEASEEHRGQNAVSLFEVRPRLFAQVQPDETPAPRMRRRA